MIERPEMPELNWHYIESECADRIDDAYMILVSEYEGDGTDTWIAPKPERKVELLSQIQDFIRHETNHVWDGTMYHMGP